ncbi:unnamed protein product [Arctogadus glacialis]
MVHLMFHAKLLRDCRVPSLLVTFRDDLFTMFAFPYATLVLSIFWAAHAAGRAQFTPLVPGGAIAPPLLNHARHTIIVPLVLVQMYIQNHVYSSRLKSVPLICFSGVLCISWLQWVHHASGIWVYTFLGEISLMSRLVISGVTLGLLLLMHLLGQELSGRIWGNLGTQKKRN